MVVLGASFLPLCTGFPQGIYLWFYYSNIKKTIKNAFKALKAKILNRWSLNIQIQKFQGDLAY